MRHYSAHENLLNWILKLVYNQISLYTHQLDEMESRSYMQLTMKEEVKGGQEPGSQGIYWIQKQHKEDHDNTTYKVLSSITWEE